MTPSDPIELRPVDAVLRRAPVAPVKERADERDRDADAHRRRKRQLKPLPEHGTVSADHVDVRA